LALHYYGASRVHCFVDNNRHGQILYGKQVISFEDLLKIHSEYTVVVTTLYYIADTIKEQCSAYGIPAVSWGEMVTWHDYESNAEIRKFNNLHFGERCFLIGNGPSLQAADLDKICSNNEISFACNMIYKIFSETKWRPDYFFLLDVPVIQTRFEEFSKLDTKIKFILNPKQILSLPDRDKVAANLKSGAGDTYFLNKIITTSVSGLLTFSEDASRALCTTGTVMYAMIQMAVYMGFKEIYLLGVDNTLVSATCSSRTNINHFYTDKQTEYKEIDAMRATSSMDMIQRHVDNDYSIANEYCREHEIKIHNATRGGTLEVFERVNIDSLFMRGSEST
jgi:hypothetical protein